MLKLNRDKTESFGEHANSQSATVLEKATQTIATASKSKELTEGYLETIFRSTFNFEDVFPTFTEGHASLKEWNSKDAQKFEEDAGSNITVVNSVISIHGDTKINPKEKVLQSVERFVETNTTLSGDKEQLINKASEIYDYLLEHCTRIKYSLASYDARYGVEKQIDVPHEPENPPTEQKSRNLLGAVPYAIVSGGAPAAIGFYLGNLSQISPNSTLNLAGQVLVWFSGNFAVTGFYIGTKLNKVRDTKKVYFRLRDEFLGKEVQVQRDVILAEEHSHLKPSGGNYTGREASYELKGNLNLPKWASKNPGADLFRAKIIDSTPSDMVAVETLEVEIDRKQLYTIFDGAGARHELLFKKDEEGFVSNGEKLEIEDRRKTAFSILEIDAKQRHTGLRKALGHLRL